MDDEDSDINIVSNNQPLRLDIKLFDKIVEKVKKSGFDTEVMLELSNILSDHTLNIMGVDPSLDPRMVSLNIDSYNIIQNVIVLGLVRDKMFLDIMAKTERDVVGSQEIVRVIKLMMALLKSLPEDAKEPWALPPATNEGEIVKDPVMLESMDIEIVDELGETDEELKARVKVDDADDE